VHVCVVVGSGGGGGGGGVCVCVCVCVVVVVCVRVFVVLVVCGARVCVPGISTQSARAILRGKHREIHTFLCCFYQIMVH
jgi:hypothetical protein